MIHETRHYMWYKICNRWKIAIKTTRVINSVSQSNRNIDEYSQSGYKSDDEISSLMEEAKTMWKVGSYHENIVNLQGITVKVEAGTLSQVCFTVGCL